MHGKYIPRKVVFLEIFFNWFKCTNYYGIKTFLKIQLEIPFIRCTWDGIKCRKDTGKCKCMGNITPRQVVFLTVNILRSVEE